MTTKTYLRVLRLAAANKLPHDLDPSSSVCYRSTHALISKGYLSAMRARPSSAGLCYVEPRITVKGKELLRRLEAQTTISRLLDNLACRAVWNMCLIAAAGFLVWKQHG